MNRPTLTIDLAALSANYKMLQHLKPGADCAGIVKADAYGLGIKHIAPALKKAGCSTFFVAWAFEAIPLRKAIGTTPAIYVFNGPYSNDIDLFETHNLRPVLNTLAQIEFWQNYDQTTTKPAILHIDTGMNRLGLSLEDAEKLLAEKNRHQNLNITHIMSHYACASQAKNPVNLTQQLKYQNLFEELQKLFPKAKNSLSASAGLFLQTDYKEDMTRPGIALYGGGPMDEIEPSLKTVCTLTAPVLQIRKITPGESVGYGSTFTATRDSLIATVGIGYADGLPRCLSNTGAVIINGQSCPMVGRVSMDLIGIDITDLEKPIQAGDTVEIFGHQQPIEDIAKAAKTISYELLAGLTPRVARHYT